MARRLFLAALFVFAFMLALHAAEPTEMFLALDTDGRSQMLRYELERDWSRPNSAVLLTVSRRHEVQTIALESANCQQRLRRRFRIRYVTGPDVPILPLPAIRIAQGRWETLDARAFLYETIPLHTLDWYRQLYDYTARDGMFGVAEAQLRRGILGECRGGADVFADYISRATGQGCDKGFIEGYSGEEDPPLPPWKQKTWLRPRRGYFYYGPLRFH